MRAGVLVWWCLLGLFAGREVVAAPPRGVTARELLKRRADEALRKSRIEVNGQRYLAAGSYGFNSMWTRDFGFASRGLLARGEHDAVRRQLDAILTFTSADGQVPRVLDSGSINWRVASGVARRRLGLSPPNPVRTRPLRAQMLDEHGSPALDGGPLIVHAALDYVAASGDDAWLAANGEKLGRMLRRLHDRYAASDGLIVQPKYSDWQDSVQRKGKTFYMNLLYLTAARRLGARSGISPAQLARVERAIDATFFDPARGLYRSIAGADLVSLDGNLLALDLGYVDPGSARGATLYAALKRSPLWTRGGVPGSVTVGDYPRAWPHLVSRVVGLRHYHDQLHWSWLTALSAKVAHRMGDVPESERIFERLSEMVEQDKTVGEIYRVRGGRLRPFRSLGYQSADDFTWGAGMIRHALEATQPPRRSDM